MSASFDFIDFQDDLQPLLAGLHGLAISILQKASEFEDDGLSSIYTGIHYLLRQIQALLDRYGKLYTQ